MAQSTVSKIFNQIIPILENKLCEKEISFIPQSSTKQYFFDKYGIPSVIGCIDGTHVRLLRPHEDEQAYLNRKGFYSINVMMVCDHKMKITAVSPTFGGAAHDSYVWKQSGERNFLEKRFNHTPSLKEWLLGDSGYPLEPWLITPYRNMTGNDLKFNEIHSKARSLVERCIGLLKARWRILSVERVPRYSPTKLSSIINVCTALHHICIDKNIMIHFEVIPEEDMDNIVENEPSLYLRIGKRNRHYIKEALFSNCHVST